MEPSRNSGCLSEASFLNFRRKGGFLANLFQWLNVQYATTKRRMSLLYMTQYATTKRQ